MLERMEKKNLCTTQRDLRDTFVHPPPLPAQEIEVIKGFYYSYL